MLYMCACCFVFVFLTFGPEDEATFMFSVGLDV